MGVVVLSRVLARLDTVVLRVGLGEAKLDSNRVDWALLLPGELICVILALLQSGIQDLHVSAFMSTSLLLTSMSLMST
jgi:hypothetical protein